MWIRRAGVVVTLVVVMASAGYGLFGRTSETQARFASAPAGLPVFYGVTDPLPNLPPGTLLKSEKVTAPDVRGTMYRVMYASRSVQNRAVAVTGVIIVPNRQPPAGGFPVVTWGHGTNGLADKCAKSAHPTAAAPPLANALLDAGLAVASSDYEGQGTPGALPYLAGVSAGRNVIDIVRAARQLSVAHASSEYVVWGYSEGGHTAMFALDNAESYAPELELRGVVAGAPPSQLRSTFAHLTGSKFYYYVLMALVGLNEAYGDDAAPLDEVLTPKGMALVPMIKTTCLTQPPAGFLQPVRELIPYKLSKFSAKSLLKSDPYESPTWHKLLTANDPQSIETARAAPLLVVQGAVDETILPETSKALADHLCSVGQEVERWVYPDQGHAWVVSVSGKDVVNWIEKRFAGDEESYAPTGQKNVARTHCAA